MRKPSLLLALSCFFFCTGFAQDIRSLQVRISQPAEGMPDLYDTTATATSQQRSANNSSAKVLLTISFEIDSVALLDQLELDFGTAAGRQNTSFRVQETRDGYVLAGKHRAYRYPVPGHDNMYIIEMEVDETAIYQDTRVRMRAIDKSRKAAAEKECKLNRHVR